MYIESGEAGAGKSADSVEKISSRSIAEVGDCKHRSTHLQSISVKIGVQLTTMKPEKKRDEKNPLTVKSGRIFIVEKSSSTFGDGDDGREILEDKRLRRLVRDEPGEEMLEDKRLRRVVRGEPGEKMLEEKRLRSVVRGEPGEEMLEDKCLRSVVGDEPGEEMLGEGERLADDEDAEAKMMDEEETDGYQPGIFDSENEDESGGIFGGKLKSIFICKTGNKTNAESSAGGKDPALRNSADRIVKKSEIRPAELRRKRAISFVDTLMSLFIVAPLVIGQWRGIWNMMDIYNEFFPEWLCFILGSGLHVVFAITRNGFHGRFVENWRSYSAAGRVAYDLVRLVYIYVFCVACNGQWRGGWMIFSRYLGSNVWVVSFFTALFMTGLVMLRSFRNLLAPPFIVVIDRPERVFQFPTRYNVALDLYTEQTSSTVFATTAVSLLALAIMRTIRNISAPPFSLSLDSPVGYFEVPTMFRVNNTRDWSLYILDCAFSVGVVGSLVVFVWRGVWVLFEIHLFPENQEYSAIGSLIIGYIIVAVTFCLQPLMRYTCARLEGLARLLAADAFLFLSFLGTVNVWRGIWTILDLWLLPDDTELSCWITHIGCFVFLVLLNCSNSILVRGVYIDAEEEEGRCVVFPCHYLRLFFKIERQKKEARRQNLVAANKAQSRNEVNAKEVENETLLNCSNTMPTIIPANPESLV